MLLTHYLLQDLTPHFVYRHWLGILYRLLPGQPNGSPGRALDWLRVREEVSQSQLLLFQEGHFNHLELVADHTQCLLESLDKHQQVSFLSGHVLVSSKHLAHHRRWGEVSHSNWGRWYAHYGAAAIRLIAHSVGFRTKLRRHILLDRQLLLRTRWYLVLHLGYERKSS